MNYIEPKFEKTNQDVTDEISSDYRFSQCRNQACNKIAIWVDQHLVYPKASLVEEPNKHMPKELKNIYQEESSILENSPRASAALLRHLLEKLLTKLGADDNRLVNRIKTILKEHASSTKLEKTLTIIHENGNAAPHKNPKINTEEMERINYARTLFQLINLICEKVIEGTEKIQEMYRKTITYAEIKKDE